MDRDGNGRRVLSDDERVLWTTVTKSIAPLRDAPSGAAEDDSAESPATVDKPKRPIARAPRPPCRPQQIAAPSPPVAAWPAQARPRCPRQGADRRPARPARADAKRGACGAVAFSADRQRARRAAGAGDHRQRRWRGWARRACAGNCRIGWRWRNSASCHRLRAGIGRATAARGRGIFRCGGAGTPMNAVEFATWRSARTSRKKKPAGKSKKKNESASGANEGDQAQARTQARGGAGRDVPRLGSGCGHRADDLDKRE